MIAAGEGRIMDKIDVQWRCEACHEEAVTVAWRGKSDDLEPVMVRTRCPICGNVSTRSFRPGTLADTEETYTLDEWVKRGGKEKAIDRTRGPHEEEDLELSPMTISPDEMAEMETKADQCQPPHIAASWSLVPPVNEWYGADVPRLLAEVRRLRAENEKLLGRRKTPR
jgi:hypothetical protein